MAKQRKPQVDSKQLDFFAGLNRLPVGEIVPVPIWDDGIGGELLNILSKGLYTNPLDAIREYVQNSIDADAEEVIIQVTGNSVSILDYGSGMNDQALLQAREFGVSTKAIEENVGFRGIGIYSGFDLCEKLVIWTKTQGESVEHILEFEFKAMRDELDEARKSSDRPKVPLARLLGENTFYRKEESSSPDRSFTIVTLQELSDEHIHRLSNAKEMSDYILRNLPIRFSKDFQYGAQIEENLRRSVPGYKSSRVVVRIENEAAVYVEKPAIPDLESPQLGYIHSLDRPIGYYWACLVKGSDAISSREFHNGRFKDFAGITYKIKGFSIGGRGVARKHIPRIPDWWTGEIYVIDPNVIPTSARDDFEAGRARDELERAVAHLLNGQRNGQSFQKIAIKAQSQRAADRSLAENEARLEKIQAKVDAGDFDEYKTYAELEEIYRILDRHEKKSSSREKEIQLKKRVRTLQSRVTKEIEQASSTSERKRDAAKTAMKASDPAPATIAPPTNVDTNGGSPGEGSDSANAQHESSSAGSLLEVIERTGWVLAAEDTELFEIVGASIADILGSGSDQYEKLLKEIEERLAEAIEEA